jgi:chemotaxis response regulator CheB
MANKIKVMIVDDSAVVRQVNRETLEREPDIEVIGAAIDPIYALEKMKVQWPDVLVIDIEMPRMDGLTFLKKIMASTRRRPSSVPRSPKRAPAQPWTPWRPARWPSSPSRRSG